MLTRSPVRNAEEGWEEKAVYPAPQLEWSPYWPVEKCGCSVITLQPHFFFEEKGIESAYSQVFSATSDRIGNVLQLALNEQS